MTHVLLAVVVQSGYKATISCWKSPMAAEGALFFNN